MGEGLLKQEGSKVGEFMWARMPPKHPEVRARSTTHNVLGRAALASRRNRERRPGSRLTRA